MSNSFLYAADCQSLGLSAGSTTYTTGDTTTGDYLIPYPYYPLQTWGQEWDDATVFQPTITIREIIKEKEVTKEVEQRTLFKVFVVNPKKNGELLMDGKSVIALNENQAMLKAGVAEVAEKTGLDLEQVDVYVQVIGTFIRPRKSTQRVKVVDKEDE
jgi:hypothetical protein